MYSGPDLGDLIATAKGVSETTGVRHRSFRDYHVNAIREVGGVQGEGKD